MSSCDLYVLLLELLRASASTSAKGAMQGVRGGERLPAPAHQERMEGVRGAEHLPAPASKEQMQGVRGRQHLPAPVRQEPMHGVPGVGHLPAPAQEKQMQGVHLPAPASKEQKGADARSAGGRASASTSASGANARIAECERQGVRREMTRGGVSLGSRARAAGAAEAPKDRAHGVSIAGAR
jgi:hypothetical protein